MNIKKKMGAQKVPGEKRKCGHSVLSELLPGHRAVVRFLEIEGVARRRLLDLGLIPGTVVETMRKSPAGDPIAFKIRGAVIALRLEQGNKIYICPL